MCGNTWELKFILMMANYSTHIRINVWMINGWGYGKCALHNWNIHLCSEKLIAWRSQEIEKMSTQHSAVWGGCWKSERLFGDLWIACDGPGQWFQDHGNMPSTICVPTSVSVKMVVRNIVIQRYCLWQKCQKDANLMWSMHIMWGSLMSASGSAYLQRDIVGKG